MAFFTSLIISLKMNMQMLKNDIHMQAQGMFMVGTNNNEVAKVLGVPDRTIKYWHSIWKTIHSLKKKKYPIQA